MPTFTPGETKTPTVPLRVSPAGLECQTELFLGTSPDDKRATSGRLSFMSAGDWQSIAHPIVIPAPGVYNTYIDLYVAETLLARYIGSDPVTVLAPAMTLNLIAKRLATATSWWPRLWNVTKRNFALASPDTVRTITTPFRFTGVDPKIVLTVQELGAVTYAWGPYLADIPDALGTYNWDSVNGRLNGVPALDLPNTPNASRVTGTITAMWVGSGGRNSVVDVVFESSIPSEFQDDNENLHSGQDHAQWFLGQKVTLGNCTIPLLDGGAPALSVGDRVTFDAFLYWPIGAYSAKWYARNFRKARLYPDAFYDFTGYIRGRYISGTPPAIYDIDWAVGGGATPCQVCIVLWNWNWASAIWKSQFVGPGVSTFRADTRFQIGYEFSAHYAVYANPEMDAIWNPSNWRVNNWVQVGSA